MADAQVSLIDGSLLLPNEQLTPSNLANLVSYIPTINVITDYMTQVQTAVANYENGYTSKVVLNPTDIQTYIGLIQSVTVRIGGGYDTDGVTAITPLASSLLPDLLMNLRTQQLYLCQLYGQYVDSAGQLVGPLEDTAIEDTTDTTGGFAV